MLKRLRWFGLGVATGALGSVYALFRLRQTRNRAVDPDQLVDAVGSTLRAVGRTARAAWDESREAMGEAETELTSDYIGQRPRLRDVNG